MQASRTAESISSDGTRASEWVLDAIANEEETSPLEFDQLLSDVIDPDALDALFRGGGTEGTVEFTYLGYRVQVRGDGRVDVSELDD